MLLDTAERAA